LPKNHFEVYDFDEINVPLNADAAWRKKATAQWLIKARENGRHGKSTVVCGVSVPSEALNCSLNPHLPTYFGFIKICDETIRARLLLRNWNKQLIQDNINWAHYLHAEVQQQKNHLIVNSDNISPEEVVQIFIE
jgi:hypothetical protein